MKKLFLIAAVAVLVVAAVWLRPGHDDTVAPPATATPAAARPSAAAPTTPAVTAAP